jgi:hypothetical protein
MAVKANLSVTARKYLAEVGIDDPDVDENRAAIVWLHALAENADGVRSDWPRIPFPADKVLLLESAALGRRVAQLLDTES